MKKTRRFLAIFLILTLANSATAFVSNKLATSENNMSSPVLADESFAPVSQRLQTPNYSVRCGEKMPPLFNTSQRKLFEVVANFSCRSAEKEILGQSMTFESCSMISNCLSEVKTLSEYERDWLKSELMGFLVRENLKTEIKQYEKSEKLRDLIGVTKALPKEFKNKVQFCPNIKASTSTCLNEKIADRMAKATFYSLFSTRTADVFTIEAGAGRSSDLIRSAAQASTVRRANLEYNNLNDKFEAIVKYEKDSGKLAASWLKNFAPKEDPLLVAIVKAYASKEKQGNPTDLKSFLKKTVKEFISTERDAILSYNEKISNSAIDKAIDKMDISENDIMATERLALSEKMNNLRVEIANENFANDCDKSVLTIGQMCSKVSESLKEAKINQTEVKKENIFKLMLDSYKNAGQENTTIEEKKQIIERLAHTQGQVYNSYVSLLFNLNACHESFPDLSRPSKAEENYIKKEEDIAQREASGATQRIYQVAQESPTTLIKTLQNSGFDFRSIPGLDNKGSSQSDEMADKVTRASPRELPAPEAIKNPSENLRQENPRPMINNGIQNYQDLAAVSATENANKTTSGATEALDERLRSLEKKESSLGKKMPSPDSSVEALPESQELSELKREIAELKNKKNNEMIPAKNNESATAQNFAGSEKSGFQGAPSGGPTSLSSRFDREAPERLAIEQGVAPSRLAAPAASAEYAGETAVSAALGRAPASAAPGAQGLGKGGGDKGGLTGALLTKRAEASNDPAMILENPNEGDISKAMERTNGEPFIIRENGELIKVAPVLDDKGKLVLLSDGTIKYKKIKLSKKQLELIAADNTNVIKAAKEVGIEPIRLYKLKSMLKGVLRE